MVVTGMHVPAGGMAGQGGGGERVRLTREGGIGGKELGERAGAVAGDGGGVAQGDGEQASRGVRLAGGGRTGRASMGPGT